MFAELFSQLGHALVALALGIASFLGYEAPIPVFLSTPEPVEIVREVPVAAIQAVADYRSSLVSQISAAATSLTVVSTSTASGENLVPGRTYGLKLGGREYVIGTLATSGRQFTSLTRGVSLITGTTTAATAEIWGRGTSVEITDAPILLEISNKISGYQGFDSLLSYVSGISCSATSASTSICSKTYFDNLIAQGAATSSASVAGIVRLATSDQAASSTNLGVDNPLALHNLISTSSPYTIGNWIPVTDDDGKLNQTFWRLGDSFTWTGAHTFNTATTSMNGSTSIAGTVANPLRINGVYYSFPTTQTASSSVLYTDGNGRLSWNPVVQTIDTGSFSKAINITGTQTINHGLGRIPTYISVTAVGACDAGGTVSLCQSFGTATSTLSERSISNTITTATVQTNTSSLNIIQLIDSSGGNDVIATLSGLTSTTFTLDFTTNVNAGGTKEISWTVQ